MNKNSKKTKYIIAIDGPAASGKSTTAKELAKRLEYVYIDTGAMYRACGLIAERLGIELNDEQEIVKMMQNINIEIKYEPTGNRIYSNGEEITSDIRATHVGKLASDISALGVVREEMTKLQRQLGESGGIVMDGRDIGTVVFPHADYKFFMDADLDVRANRRWNEEKLRGSLKDLASVKEELRIRDFNDSQREIAPLKKAEDAVEIDSSSLSISEQVLLIEQYIKDNNE